MSLAFLVCAVLGGVILVCQFLLTLAGLGGEHDFDGGHHVEIGDHHGDAHTDTGSTWFFNVLSFRALVAGVTFFGLAGLAVSANAAYAGYALSAGIMAGLLAMVSVAYLMGLLATLQSEGNVRIERAFGAVGVVYLTIPANGGGQGKVTVNVQHRTMEYAAVTESDQPLQTGATVLILGLAAPGVVKVAANDGGAAGAAAAGK